MKMQYDKDDITAGSSWMPNEAEIKLGSVSNDDIAIVISENEDYVYYDYYCGPNSSLQEGSCKRNKCRKEDFLEVFSMVRSLDQGWLIEKLSREAKKMRKSL